MAKTERKRMLLLIMGSGMWLAGLLFDVFVFGVGWIEVTPSTISVAVAAFLGGGMIALFLLAEELEVFLRLFLFLGGVASLVVILSTTIDHPELSAHLLANLCVLFGIPASAINATSIKPR